MAMEPGDADRLLEPHKPRLNRIVRDGWASLGRYRADLAVMSRGARAFLVRDFMIANALREFDGIAGVRPVFRGGRFFLAFGRLYVQLKKFNKRGRPSNYPTAQAQAIIDQKQGELFDDYRNITVVTAGYILNKFETEIEKVTVACHEGQLQLWALDIPEGSTGTQPASVVSIQPPPPPLSRVVRREPAAQEQARTDDGATS